MTIDTDVSDLSPEKIEESEPTVVLERVTEEEDAPKSIVAKYLIYIIGCTIVVVVACFCVWHCCRKQMLSRVELKLATIRHNAKPDILVRNEINQLLKTIKYKADKEKAEADNCAICTDDFKVGQKIT